MSLKIKKHAMALAALTIAIGSVTLMSFKNKTLENPWFEFNSGDPYESSDYNPNPISAPDDCEAGETVCAIQTKLVNGQPEITPELMTEITNALTNRESSEHVRVKE